MFCRVSPSGNSTHPKEVGALEQEYALRVQQQESESSDGPNEEEGDENGEEDMRDFMDVGMVVLEPSNNSDGKEKEVMIVME